MILIQAGIIKMNLDVLTAGVWIVNLMLIIEIIYRLSIKKE
jgi:hypothetical protein